MVIAATIDNNIGEILSDQGHVDRALELFDDAERVWRAASYAIGLAVAAMNRARARTRRGRPRGPVHCSTRRPRPSDRSGLRPT